MNSALLTFFHIENPPHGGWPVPGVTGSDDDEIQSFRGASPTKQPLRSLSDSDHVPGNEGYAKDEDSLTGSPPLLLLLLAFFQY
ncbi:hypothetical protein M378DRAFT_166711 [Amanita muscaria Koide BX008]|uniref:Uncharacterized protein n=1 Tax=Amanita muscaria (strain Koide BX008) TaxID=946122 RepID=A0A0C2WJA4_AMAMK|nr:hypothetical protein M378DRAFT_166711 [Amanita muscaria Koide BX008]